jgi:hypothetical protein
MQHNFRTRDQSVDCIGSEFLTREDFSGSEVSSVLQAGRSHRLRPAFSDMVIAKAGLFFHLSLDHVEIAVENLGFDVVHKAHLLA